MTTTPILQFGTSRFLQAHVDLFVSEALARGEALGTITLVQSSGDPARRSRLEALAAPGGFPVRIEGLEDGRASAREVRVNSVVRALATETDWPEVARIAAEEAEIIVSNTGDSGWAARPEDDALDFRQGMSYPAKLRQLLLARFRAGGRCIVVMPTELVARNGDRLRSRVLELAGDGEFAEWIGSHVVFANSLVDRIVSQPLEPAGAVAEPYALWAIEEKEGLILPCRHPAVEIVADLGRIERLKLHILNLGHSYMVANWLRRHGLDDALVRDEMADPATRADLEDLYAREVLPVFAAAGQGDEARHYVETTLDRFANPFLAHRLSDIAQNHAEKVQRRIAAFLDWSEQLGVGAMQRHLRDVVTQTEMAAT
ncbi:MULTISPECIES: mannitol dehydrogenase family protein [Mesorhizobium]|uniref:Mannitol dehydrogenase family protein n=1 Tax=Mesorhizobium denitrificans TaxID=2294114 RepID=A0A371XCQ0_9HYPH|nr:MULTISPECIES: mannitol dehydrogenase family protein [Mesorhizobium]RFC67000.1 mannitol dehydrogenase family protein [Mesorhizobium denitrificans]